jgi:glycosyltransferase involved in cell wall biosynthesis
MKVLLLSKADNAHTIKWAKGLASRNIQVGIFSLNPCPAEIYSEYPNITVYDYILDFSMASPLKKLNYFKAIPTINKVIKDFSPDLVHAHYISSYGLLGSLTNAKPYIISVWGADIYDYPRANFITKALTKFTLNRANKVLSTSHVMAVETAKYTSKEIEVTPFGIDLTKFKSFPVDERLFSTDDFVIGTIKALEVKYGIDILLKAFSKLKEEFPDLPLKLLLVGTGSQFEYLKKLAEKLNVSDDVKFIGKVKPDEVPSYINNLDIYAAFSVQDGESFGVAVIEASACEKPVVVSNVGGLPEVVDNRKTGLVVKARDVDAAYLGLKELLIDRGKREKLGKNGRARVKDLYDFENNLTQMISIYKDLLQPS